MIEPEFGAPGSSLRPALSVRIAEAPRDKSRLAIGVDQLLDLARAHGFEGISVRASAVSVESSIEIQTAFADALRTRGLKASMVTGDLPLAINNSSAPGALRNITPYLDLAERLGAGCVRVMLHRDEDVAAARRSCDEAAERGLILAQQCHWGSLAETVDSALSMVRMVARPNFGITFEPANLLAAGGPYAEEAAARLVPHVVNVYFQNVVLEPSSSLQFVTRARGPVGIRYRPLSAPDGIDMGPALRALYDAGYRGWFTIHQPLLPEQAIESAVAEAGRYIRAQLNALIGRAHLGSSL